MMEKLFKKVLMKGLEHDLLNSSLTDSQMDELLEKLGISFDEVFVKESGERSGSAIDAPHGQKLE